ncbi:aminotransferase class III-fold pyridoxal phosphate-dependent enzyme [Sneathiella sp. HT1-7]|uniref:aminotransferase class III-fold pyridoxal phosphate-dependent enzyme n=1 Tax=Sneathiella sp. HT1-7 TaxID=2887192 RepID=UPI001D143175|nr:aminotransferase class III-fold pyridoxal phosphate-dependent enzyme [Sneathiella sp. HT1-7]MCC3306353.1 aminotransferase class III-fold pyridoxal phosphate-dependent enzyme [Sneathiella sp. HT1-7]
MNEKQQSRQEWVHSHRSGKEISILERDRSVSILGNNNNPSVMVIERADGIYVENASGQKFVDLYGNNCHHIGYRHPDLLAALIEQMGKATFSGRGFTNLTSVKLGETLARLWGNKSARIATAPSGSDAIEIAVTIAKAATQRYKTISFYDAYHGRSFGALSLGGRSSDKTMLGPMVPGAIHVPPFHRHGDEGLGFGHEPYALHSLESIRTAFKYEPDIAAVVVEPIRNGAYVPPDWYWPEVRSLCDQYGALLVFDEIPTGLGKTGALFNHTHFDVRPDITVVGKALGGAVLPVAAVMVGPSVSIPKAPNLGYFTHEKNLLSARAALTVLEIIQNYDLISRTINLGSWAKMRLQDLASRCPSVREIRCVGLMAAIDFGPEDGDREFAANFAQLVYRETIDSGVIPILPSGSSMTLSVPLVISQEELAKAIDVVETSIQTVEARIS